MRVVIINDCAYVGLTLARELRRRGIEVEYYPRGVSLLDKTVKAAINVIRAVSKKAIIHVNYAWQDAWLASLLKKLQLKKLDVLHCHGSDVRWRQYEKFGWLVRFSLRSAKKILVSTPDLLEHVPNAIYLPNPIDTEMFRPLGSESPPRALYQRLWYEKLPEEIPKLLKENEIELEILESKPYKWEEMPSVLNQYGVFISRFTIPSYTKTCLEAMSCGLATIDWRHKGILSEWISLLADENARKKIGGRNREWIEANHDVKLVVDKLISIYEEI